MCWSCILQFHWIHLLVLIVLKNSLEFSVYEIMSSVNSFTSSFAIWMLFASFSCLNSLAKTSSTKLNKMARAHNVVLFLVLGRKLSVFHHWEDVNCGIFITFFYHFVKVSREFLQLQIQHSAKLSIRSERGIYFQTCNVSEHLHHINLFIGCCLKMSYSKTRYTVIKRKTWDTNIAAPLNPGTIKEMSRMTSGLESN